VVAGCQRFRCAHGPYHPEGWRSRSQGQVAPGADGPLVCRSADEGDTIAVHPHERTTEPISLDPYDVLHGWKLLSFFWKQIHGGKKAKVPAFNKQFFGMQGL
jgi:hypothetical protein